MKDGAVHAHIIGKHTVGHDDNVSLFNIRLRLERVSRTFERRGKQRSAAVSDVVDRGDDFIFPRHGRERKSFLIIVVERNDAAVIALRHGVETGARTRFRVFEHTIHTARTVDDDDDPERRRIIFGNHGKHILIGSTV